MKDKHPLQSRLISAALGITLSASAVFIGTQTGHVVGKAFERTVQSMPQPVERGCMPIACLTGLKESR